MGASRTIKTVLIGPDHSGKTAILAKLTRDVFVSDYMPTIGVDFATKTLSNPNGDQAARFQIWDTAGQERFSALTPAYARGSQIILYVLDGSVSLDALTAQVGTLSQYKRQMEGTCTPNLELLLINKADLRKKVDDAAFNAQIACLGFDPEQVISCSAKADKGLDLVAGALVAKIPEIFPAPAQVAAFQDPLDQSSKDQSQTQPSWLSKLSNIMASVKSFFVKAFHFLTFNHFNKRSSLSSKDLIPAINSSNILSLVGVDSSNYQPVKVALSQDATASSSQQATATSSQQATATSSQQATATSSQQATATSSQQATATSSQQATATSSRHALSRDPGVTPQISATASTSFKL